MLWAGLWHNLPLRMYSLPCHNPQAMGAPMWAGVDTFDTMSQQESVFFQVYLRYFVTVIWRGSAYGLEKWIPVICSKMNHLKIVDLKY